MRKPFSYCVSLNQQAPTQPADKPQEYDLYGKAIGRNSNHIMPKRNYTGEKCNEHKECGKAFGYPLSLRIHVQPHAAEKRYDLKKFYFNGFGDPQRPFFYSLLPTSLLPPLPPPCPKRLFEK